MADLDATIEVATAGRHVIEKEKLVRKNWTDMRAAVSDEWIRYKLQFATIGRFTRPEYGAHLTEASLTILQMFISAIYSHSGARSSS